MRKLYRALIAGDLLQQVGRYIKIYFLKIVRKIDLYIGSFARKRFVKKVEIVPNRIMFMTYQNDFVCNPKYIAKEIIKEDLPIEIYWAVKKSVYNNPVNFPEGITLVRRDKFECYEALASSKIWIDNSLNCVWRPIPKKEGQVYFETWHGSMGLKKAGEKDVRNNRYWVKRAKACGKLVDYCISDSEFENEVYRETHWRNTPILEYGHPRNDIFFDVNIKEDLKKDICLRYEISNFEDVNICLYAPTFRDSRTFEYYDIDFERLVNALKQRFGGIWIILSRYHFHNRKKGVNIINECEFVINVTDYPDMQELMLISDIGITDYSSWICDYVLSEKAGFIYARDIEEYNNERGLYYPLETTPFPIATNNDELIKNIIEFDYDKYRKDVKKFLEDRGSKEDGHASERVVRKIKEIMDI